MSTSNQPPNHPDVAMHRRRFLQRLGLGGMTLAAGSCFVYHYSQRNPFSGLEPSEAFQLALDRMHDSREWNQKAIDVLYQEMSSSVDSIVQEAEWQKKKPLFVLGEYHGSAKTKMLELILIRVLAEKAKKYPSLRGAPVCLEDGPNQPNEDDGWNMDMLPCAIAACRSGLIPVGVESEGDRWRYLWAARELDGDEREKELLSVDDARDKTMTRNIDLHCTKGGMVICGATHCRGIIEGLKGKDYLIGGLVFLPNNMEKEYGSRTDSTTRNLPWARDPNNMRQIKFDEIELHSANSNTIAAETEHMLQIIEAAHKHYNSGKTPTRQ